MFADSKEIRSNDISPKEQHEVSMEMVIEKLETDEDVYELIEYDGTIEDLVEEDWAEVKNEDEAVKAENSSRKPYAARKQGGGRQIHQCQCGIIFSSSHRLRNHIRVRHEFVPESELLPCNQCDKK